MICIKCEDCKYYVYSNKTHFCTSALSKITNMEEECGSYEEKPRIKEKVIKVLEAILEEVRKM